jgi:hypothetical protein
MNTQSQSASGSLVTKAVIGESWTCRNGQVVAAPPAAVHCPVEPSPFNGVLAT